MPDPVVAPVVEGVAPAAPATPVVPPVVPPVVTPPVTEPTPVTPPVVATQEPVVPPVGEPPVVEAPVVPKYEHSENPFFDAAAGILHEAGFDAKLVAEEFTSDDGVSAETRAAMVAKLGEGQVVLLEGGLAKERQAATDSVETVLHTAAGSKAEWDAIQLWTTTADCGMTPEGEIQYNEMLNAGGVQAQLAVQALKEAYMQSPGFVKVEGHVAADAITPITPAVEMISRAQYTTEKREAVRTQNAVLVAELEGRARYTMDNDQAAWRGAPQHF